MALAQQPTRSPHLLLAYAVQHARNAIDHAGAVPGTLEKQILRNPATALVVVCVAVEFCYFALMMHDVFMWGSFLKYFMPPFDAVLITFTIFVLGCDFAKWRSSGSDRRDGLRDRPSDTQQRALVAMCTMFVFFVAYAAAREALHSPSALVMFRAMWEQLFSDAWALPVTLALTLFVQRLTPRDERVVERQFTAQRGSNDVPRSRD